MCDDPFIGKNVKEYVIEKNLGSGVHKKVYVAFDQKMEERRAIKFATRADLPKGWENEIKKVIRLKNVDNVVRYHENGTVVIGGVEYIYIMEDYIEGEDLRKVVDNKQITIPMMVDVVEMLLNVLHACKEGGIHHSDLHLGNILIENPNPLRINENQRKPWVTDFGYGISSGSSILDDYKGFATIINDCVESIDVHSLDYSERASFRVLKEVLPRLLHEKNQTEGLFVENPKEIMEEFHRELNKKPDEHGEYTKAIGDFLAAESIGERYDEWKSLFSTNFLKSANILDLNTCVLTGLRGCGKTMMFKRLSFPLTHNKKLGSIEIDNKKIPRGFYLNARHIAEAFPWLPSEKEEDARNQIIYFFHLKWCKEILEWLKLEFSNEGYDLSWLDRFFNEYYPEYHHTSSMKGANINHIQSLIDAELRSSKLGAKYRPNNWPIVDYEFLESFIKLIKKNCGFPNSEPFYFFLDDYSSPMVSETTQKILNPIIFRRSDSVFFKISTESTESFITTGLNNRILENGSDYSLVNLASIVIQSQDYEIENIINSIFEKRISRTFGRKLKLGDFLGTEKLTGNLMAERIKDGKRVEYHGLQIFTDVWSSDIREMIRLFSTMLGNEGDEVNKKIELYKDGDKAIVSAGNQNKALKDAGGLFVRLLGSTTSPIPSDSKKAYGTQLQNIVKAFQDIASYDLKTKFSKNEENNPPKQARRIEIKTLGEYEGDVRDYYQGLIRYGVFIKDDRAKSVGGKLGTRLYFRGLLIPYSGITFSKRDSITMSWKEFELFLLNPLDFAEKYKGKRKDVESFQRNQKTLKEGW